MNATQTDRIILAAFHSSVFAIGLPGNILVITAYSLSKEFRSRPSNSCLLLLTIGDLLTSLFAPPYYATGLIVKHFDKTNPELYLRVCKVAIFGLTTTGIVRIFAFTAMSTERFIAIVYPYFYARYCTRRKIFIAAAIIWIHSMLSTLPAVLVEGWLEYYASNESICKFTSSSASIVYTAPMVLFNFTIPTVTVILMNVRVFWIARVKLRKILHEKQQFCPQCDGLNAESENCSDTRRKTSLFSIKQSARRESKDTCWSNNPTILIEKYEGSHGDVKSHQQKTTLDAPNGFQSEIKSGSKEGRLEIEKNLGGHHNIRVRTASFNESLKSTSTLENIEEIGIEDQRKENAHKGDTQKEIKWSEIQLDTENHSYAEVGMNSNVSKKQQRKQSVTGNRAVPASWLRRKSSFLVKSLTQGRCKHGHSNRSASEMKILLSTLVLAFAFTLTWAPYVMTRLIITVWKETNSLRLQMFASASTVINCGLNPIIILLTRKEVRKILHEKFIKKS